MGALSLHTAWSTAPRPHSPLAQSCGSVTGTAAHAIGGQTEADCVCISELSVCPISSSQSTPTHETTHPTQPNPTHRNVKTFDPQTNPTHNPIELHIQPTTNLRAQKGMLFHRTIITVSKTPSTNRTVLCNIVCSI